MRPVEWADRAAGANAIIVMEEDTERSKQFAEPKRAVRLHVVKNRGGETATIDFDFSPGLSKFGEQGSERG